MTTMSTQHTLNLKTLPEPRSRDKLFVRYDLETSEARTLEAGMAISCYVVTNKTKGSEYRVELFVDAAGRKVGRCDCLARIICKHILRAILLHIARKRALAAEAKV
jgi:hypothetical protein